MYPNGLAGNRKSNKELWGSESTEGGQYVPQKK
jgi:hypothetical protein